MDILALIQAEVDERKQKIADLDRDGLVAWSRKEFEEQEPIDFPTVGLCIRWLLSEKPEVVLEEFTKSAKGHETLQQAAAIFRENGEDLPKLVANYLLDTALGVKETPQRTRSSSPLPNGKNLGGKVRDWLIFQHVSLIVDSTDFLATRNDATKDKALRDSACSIVAEAIGNISEDRVERIYREYLKDEERRRLALESDDDPLLSATDGDVG